MLVLGWLGACGEAVQKSAPLPPIDTAGMEPQVAAKIEWARSRVAQEHDSAAAWGSLGMVLQAHELFDAAVDCYREAAALDAADYRWPYLSALALQRERLTEAIASFAQAAARRPANPAFYISYGDALLSLGRPHEAEMRYAEALELDAASSHALYGLARVAFTAGDVDAAREHLERAARLAPRHGEVHLLLAQVYFRAGERQKAAREELLAAAYPDPTRAADPVVEAMQAEAVNSRAYTQQGLRFVKAGRFAEAEEAFRQVLAIRPGNARDYANLGGALARQGKLEEAIGSYRQALELEPEDPWTLNNLALALADRGELEAAAARLDEALQIDPAYAEAHLNLGLVRSGQGRLDEALAAYRQALRVDPGLIDAHTNLGSALAAAGRLQEAIDHWQRALEIDGRDLAALYNLSVALSQQGEHRAAIERLREGLSYAPNSSRLASLLAWELATVPDGALRDGREAVRLARRVYEAYPDRVASADVLAAALAEAGRFEEAVRMMEEAIRLAQRQGGASSATQELQARLDGYRQNRAFRQPSTAPR